jgi:hypothetical protein
MNYGYVESVNRRTIDQTVVTPTITTTLQQKNDWLPVSNNYSGNFGAGYKINKNASMGASIIPCTKVMNLQKDVPTNLMIWFTKIHHLKHSKRLGKQNTNGNCILQFCI